MTRVVFHSDRGTQYTSEEFAELCHRHGVSQSMGRTRVCWDNAPAESFLATWEDHYRHPTKKTMAVYRSCPARGRTPGSAPGGLCGFGEFLVHLVHVFGRVGHVVVEPPGQECEERAGEERCSNLDRDGGLVAGVRAPFQLRSGVT